MDDNEIVCDETYDTYMRRNIEVIDITEAEVMEPEQKFNSENIDLNLVEISSTKGYQSYVTTTSKQRMKRCKESPSTILLTPVHSRDLKLNLRDRFRPIRPKLMQPSSSVQKHKFELPMTTLPSKRVFVPSTVPIKKKIQYITPSGVSNEINNCIGSNSSNNVNNIDNSDINNSLASSNIKIVNSNTINNSDNIQRVTEENKIDETVEIQNSNTTVNFNCNSSGNSNNINDSSNSNNSSCSKDNKDLHITKVISKSHKNSTALFFESMAQTVLNLPNEVQADIKMQICKIVTNAEIRYCESQAKSKTEN